MHRPNPGVTEKTAEQGLLILEDRRESMERLKRDKDLLLDHYAGMAPEALDSLTPEERHQVYKMLRLKVTAHLDGNLELTGDLVRVPYGGKVEESKVGEERSKLETTP